MRLTNAILVIGLLAFPALAQSKQDRAVPAMTDQDRKLTRWLSIVRAAEAVYKNKNGSFGDLAALRDARLLDPLIFESDKSPGMAPDRNFVPKSTLFEVSTSGEHYRIRICEDSEESDTHVCASGDELGTTGFLYKRHYDLPQPEDGPEGPLLSLPT